MCLNKRRLNSVNSMVDYMLLLSDFDISNVDIRKLNYKRFLFIFRSKGWGKKKFG